MAKELPYFKFQPSEWVTGDITLCSMEAQGLFINLCCFYWIKDCSISLANAQQRFSNCLASLEELQNKQIFEVSDEGEIIIDFLDEQMQKFIDISVKRSKSGGMRAKANAKQLHSKSSANANILRDRERDREDINIPFEIFWDAYDKKEDRVKCERKWNGLTDADREACMAAVPAYVQSTPDKKFRKNPATYLNNKSWTNEIISYPTPVARPYVPPQTPSYINKNYVQPV